MARGVDRDDHGVVARVERTCSFTVEGREAALVIANALAIYPDVRKVVCRADVNEGAHVRGRLDVKIALEPHDTFIAEKRGVLGVPVARDVHYRRGGEVVFVVVRTAGDVRVGVPGVAVVAYLAIRFVQGPGRRRIDQIVPGPIERGDGAMVDPDQQCRQRFLLRKRRVDCCETEEDPAQPKYKA